MSDRRVFVAGVALLALYLGQAAAGLEWGALVHLQANDTYQVLSGLALAGYVLHQLGGRRAVTRHKVAGALAPLILYAHSSRFAYGYLALLAVVYLATASLGLAHRPVILARSRGLYAAWFITHVATTMMLVVLGGYHVVVALAYE